MSRSYEHRAPIDEYLERITQMQKTPTMIPDFPHFPNVHEVLDNNSTYVKKHDDRPKTTSQVNRQKHQAPEAHKKVHFAEHGKHDVYEGKTIDAEADGFIKRKHKSFELCKWDTFKA